MVFVRVRSRKYGLENEQWKMREEARVNCCKLKQVEVDMMLMLMLTVERFGRCQVTPKKEGLGVRVQLIS